MLPGNVNQHLSYTFSDIRNMATSLPNGIVKVRTPLSWRVSKSDKVMLILSHKMDAM
jgi:hypothetical protein